MPRTRRQRRGGFSLNPMSWFDKKEEPKDGASPVSTAAASSSLPPNVPQVLGGRRSRRSRRSRIRKRR
jgi:hypothetical protein